MFVYIFDITTCVFVFVIVFVYVFRTDVIFSPDDQLIITGTSVERGEGFGKMVFMDRTNLERVDEIPVVQGEVR